MNMLGADGLFDAGMSGPGALQFAWRHRSLRNNGFIRSTARSPVTKTPCIIRIVNVRAVSDFIDSINWAFCT